MLLVSSSRNVGTASDSRWELQGHCMTLRVFLRSTSNIGCFFQWAFCTVEWNSKYVLCLNKLSWIPRQWLLGQVVPESQIAGTWEGTSMYFPCSCALPKAFTVLWSNLVQMFWCNFSSFELDFSVSSKSGANIMPYSNCEGAKCSAGLRGNLDDTHTLWSSELAL